MTLAGPFRQHWSTTDEDRESKIIQFTHSNAYQGASRPTTAASVFRTSKNIFSCSSNDNEMTFSVWIYPILGGETFESDIRDDVVPPVSGYGGNTPHYIFNQYDQYPGVEEYHSFLRIDSNGYDAGQQGIIGSATGKVWFRFKNIQVEHSTDTINYNSWNHILISMKRSGNDPANDQIDFAINGLTYSNQFAPINTRYLASGDITRHSTSNTLIDNDLTDPSVIGSRAVGSNSSFQYLGHMYQMYFDNKYYDLTTYSNVSLFNSTAKRNNAALPSRGTKPLVLITDFNDFNSGSNDAGTIERYNISSSTLSKP